MLKRDAGAIAAGFQPAQLAQVGGGEASAARAAAFAEQAQAALGAGDLALAKRYYGQAIDDWITLGDLGAATAMCRHLLNVDPAIVRAHCTLTFLAIARGDLPAIEASLSAYVTAARRGGAEAFARPSIQLMGRATADPRVKALFADALDLLGDAPAAERMRRQVGGGSVLQKLIEDGGLDRWRGLLQSATIASNPGGPVGYPRSGSRVER